MRPDRFSDVGASKNSCSNSRVSRPASIPPVEASFAAPTDQWAQIQRDLAARVIQSPLTDIPRFVAGVDAAFSSDQKYVLAAAVVYDRIERRLVEVVHAHQPVRVPYIPTFLSFREGPAVIQAIGQLTHPFGAVLFDGQGMAHPRGCGIATHLAVMLDRVGVGVAKSRLFGRYDEPGPSASSTSPLTHAGRPIGVVLRTRDRVRPLFISVGHRIDLPGAIRLVQACCSGYRLPEPTRQADREVARQKRLWPPP